MAPVRKKTGRKRAAAKGVARKTSSVKATKARRRPAKPRRRTAEPLEKLSGEEAQQLIIALVKRHPALREEATELATALLESVDAHKLGIELGKRLRDLDLFDLSNRSCRDPGRYVEVTEAAYETLEETLAPYVVDLERRIELGLEDAARATCLGIVLGLYHACDHTEDALLAHAPDFCEGEAGYLVDQLAKQSGKLHRSRWSLPDGSAELLPEWDWLFRRRSGKRR